MEINKAPLSSQYLTSLLRQRDVAAASKKVDAVPELPAFVSERQNQRRQALSADEMRLALEAMEETKVLSGQQTQLHESRLNSRARMALSAYTAQENLTQDDARLSLQQMLGIDFYA